MVSNADGSTTSAEAILGIDLLANGSFESGNLTNWTSQDITQPLLALGVKRAGFRPNFGFPRSASTDGQFSLVHGWDGAGPGTISLPQELTLPSGGVLLSFDYRAGWNLADFGPVLYARAFRVAIEPPRGGAPLASFLVLLAEPGTKTSDTGPRVGRFDLTQFGGQSVRLVFSWSVPEATTGPAYFEIDNIRLAAGARPPLRLPEGALSPAEIGGMRLRFNAPPGASYTVLASDDLVHWTPLGAATDRGGGEFEFVDSTADSTPRRFYRINAP